MTDGPRFLGKVRCFDATQRCGVVVGITGASYFFRRASHERALAAFEPGQLVTFVDAGVGPLDRLARDVRPRVFEPAREVVQPALRAA